MVSQPQVRSRVNEAIDRLTDEFKGTISAETIRDVVTASFESYRESRITDFVPLLVYKSARAQLGAVVYAGAPSRPNDST